MNTKFNAMNTNLKSMNTKIDEGFNNTNAILIKQMKYFLKFEMI